MKKYMETLKDTYGLIGCVLIFVGLIMVFNSLAQTKIDYYTEKLKNYKLTEEANKK